MPMLPPSCTSTAGGLQEVTAVNAVVVDLPLVPVMATNGASRRARACVRGRTIRHRLHDFDRCRSPARPAAQ